MRSWHWGIALLLCGACSKPTTEPGAAPATSTAPAAAASGSIGMATMEPDGTIVLQLRAEGPGGVHGDGLLRYPKGDPKYDEISKHVGPLKPGEHKPVAPFPE
ncbi:MAG: hypothetical protein KC776_43370 [Myxococcales bacterium]|nr:hypothetical protein [Myxococcales bacterium]MCB9582305.1 hypothetical protein [Polyangiaceae bacterium]